MGLLEKGTDDFQECCSGCTGVSHGGFPGVL